MGVSDPAARRNWTVGLMTAAARESTFNPLAVNVDPRDHNVQISTGAGPDGYPNRASRGGLQVIPETFARHHQAGTSTNLYDPVANVCASMNYVMSRYRVAADGRNLASVPQFNPGSAGGGY
ncbi:transglycosylase SLT domain-containing protein [Mycobacterium sp. M1]|uniref:Transglycosylase SLT domain-containing protein n=2 Tax=Mycolicibacter acidiphilus TaxID=2835306 RepID=A0ABS5RPR7_9MYCO|nr:transglycosylase SLT domain-containing protein [Mycolicibacter acidiphilus]